MTQRSSRTAGAFDVRSIIALLFAIYGVVLTVVGVVQPAAEIVKSAGVNINLWAGIGMIAFAAVFGLWARIRPIRVPEHLAEKPSEQE
jgi:hypothetical protein